MKYMQCTVVHSLRVLATGPSCCQPLQSTQKPPGHPHITCSNPNHQIQPLQDAKYRQSILSEICKVGAAIEAALGSAQDIEGVVAPDNTITVVQTRPQV